jgi:hypothetical protein
MRNIAKYFAILRGKYHVEGKIAVNFTTTGYLEYIIAKSRLDPQQQLGLTTFKNTERNVQEQDLEALNLYNSYKKRRDVIPSTALKEALRNHLWGNKDVRFDAFEKDTRSMMNMIEDTYFDILVMFGNPRGTDYTMRTITRAKIVGDAMEVVNDGGAIQHIYSFVGRSADTPIYPKPSSVQVPIGQRVPLHKIPDYLFRLGQNIGNQNILEVAGNTDLFLKFISHDAIPNSTYDRMPDQNGIIYPVSLNTRTNNANDVIIDAINSEGMTRSTVIESEDTLLKELGLEDIQDEKRKALNTWLADSVVGTTACWSRC